MFSILNEIKDNRPVRTTGVVTASIGTACSIYILVAITGYLSFGDNVVGNIVSQYVPSVASTIGRAAIVVLVMFSYPLQVHPCRASLDAVSKWRPQGSRKQELTPSNGSPSRSSLLGQHNTKMPSRPKPEDMSELRFAIITTAIIILSYIVAMTVSSLDKVLAYVGSTGSTSISFILPGLFYYKISSPDSPHHQRLMKEDDDEDYEAASDSGDDLNSPVEAPLTWQDSWSSKVRGKQWRRAVIRRLSLALAVYGLCVMTVCLVTNVYFHTKE
jgi:amino acid permease